jgi:hypothetical protein
MFQSQRAYRVVLVLLVEAGALALVAGCGGASDELPRQAVSGTVNLYGRPLKSGIIQFLPAEPGATTAGGGSIADGKYAIAKAEGLVPGKYQVQITSPPPAEGQAKAVMPGDPLPPPKEPIPTKYNAQTTLTAQVSKEGPNTFVFDLKDK